MAVVRRHGAPPAAFQSEGEILYLRHIPEGWAGKGPHSRFPPGKRNLERFRVVDLRTVDSTIGRSTFHVGNDAERNGHLRERFDCP